MNPLHRITIATLVETSIALVAPGVVQAQQTFPTKPIRLVVTTTPGAALGQR